MSRCRPVGDGRDRPSRRLGAAITSAFVVSAIIFEKGALADGPAAMQGDSLQSRSSQQGPYREALNDPFSAFPLVVPHPPHYFRAGAEVGGVIAVGFVNYLLFTANSGGLVRQGDEKWGLRYDWPELRGKLVGSAYELDINAFSTNYVWHPFAGTAYFSVARSNHLSFTESFLFAAVGSSTWEFFGEIREKVSVNDMIVTPVAGTAIGETTMQLAGFFARGGKKAHNRVLSFIFSPIKAINELADGAEQRLAPPGETDALGFPIDPWHRFEAAVGTGMTVQSATSDARSRAYADVGFGLDFAIVNLPGYERVAQQSHLFGDGNVSSLHFGVTMSEGKVADALFATRVVPIGYYQRDAGLDRQGRLSGHGGYLGWRVGFEYGVHDFDRDRRRAMDYMGIASPVGLAAEHTFSAGPLRIRTNFDLYGGIAAVPPYALTDYLASKRETTGLPTTLRLVGYYHAVEVTVSPRVEIRLGPLLVAGQLRLDNARPITGLDASPELVDPSIGISDRRSAARAEIAWEPWFFPMRLTLGTERAWRAGSLGAFRAERSEASLNVRLGVLF